MGEALSRVLAWRDRLRRLDVAKLGTGLSPEGAREALDAALDALDALPDAVALPVRPVRRARVIPASTVFTAPVEWCAVLLARGTEVVIKRPRARAGLIDAMSRLAGDLPLATTQDRALDADLVVAMGSDATIEAIRRELPPETRLAAHGHAWSAAWVTEGWDAVAEDLALHDGRGCLSPALVFTPHPLEIAVPALARALERAEVRWPRGEVAPAEGAAIRAKVALARAVGHAAVGAGWAVAGLPLDHAGPASLPRAPTLVRIDPTEVPAALSRWRGLSAVGADEPQSWATCALGRMQRPPLRRRQDGVDWVLEETGIREEG